MIRELSNRMRAEVSFAPGLANMKELNNSWCIPFIGKYLVRITAGTHNSQKLKEHNEFTRRITDLPEGTSEVLLWRQVKRTGAKALHIFKNNNDNNMRSATVYFSNEKDMINCSRFTIVYNNNKLK